MKIVKVFVVLFILRNFINFRIVNSELKKSKFLSLFNFVVPFFFVGVVFKFYSSMQSSDYVNIGDNFEISFSLALTLIFVVMIQPIGFIFISILNFCKRDQIFRFAKLCQENFKSSKIDPSKFEIKCFITFLMLHFSIIIGSVFGLFSNFVLTIRIFISIILLVWISSTSLIVILLILFFSKFVNYLLSEIENENEEEEVWLKLLKLNDLVKAFHAAFSMQLNWALCQIIATFVVLVRKINLIQMQEIN